MYIKVSRFNAKERKKLFGKDNHKFTSGKWHYRNLAFRNLEHKCDKCGKTDCKFEVHHRDENRENNELQNLQILCLSCHRRLHRSKHVLNPSQ